MGDGGWRRREGGGRETGERVKSSQHVGGNRSASMIMGRAPCRGWGGGWGGGWGMGVEKEGGRKGGERVKSSQHVRGNRPASMIMGRAPCRVGGGGGGETEGGMEEKELRAVSMLVEIDQRQ